MLDTSPSGSAFATFLEEVPKPLGCLKIAWQGNVHVSKELLERERERERYAEVSWGRSEKSYLGVCRLSFASPPSPPSVVEHAAETFLGRGASLWV